MDLETILDRFKEKQFILYGGDQSFLERLGSRVNVMVWFTSREDEASIPPKNSYDKLLEVVTDAVYIIVGHGYAAGRKAEIVSTSILRSPNNLTKIIIWHGYPGFVVGQENGHTLTRVSKEIYKDGCVVAPEDDHVGILQEAAKILGKELTIPVPLDTNLILPDGPLYPQIEDLMPYIHLVSKLGDLTRESGEPTVPSTVMDMPIDRINIGLMNTMPYAPSVMTSAVAWGQRKLLITEIEMMIEIIRHDITRGGDGKGFILVYIGAAPGSHVPRFMELFAARYRPTIHLWDRRSRFDNIEGPGITIIPEEFKDPDAPEEGFFTDKTANIYRDTYGPNNRIILISDIRDRASEEAVMADMELQRRWVEILQPYACYLKFRPPYNGVQTMEYIDGTIFTQAWSRVKSTETRLLAYRPYVSRSYDVPTYDETMSYLNMETRMQSYHMGNVVESTFHAYSGLARPMSDIGPWIPDVADGLCTCHDCAREVQVMSKYLGLMKVQPSQRSMISLVASNTRASRPRDSEGNLRTLWYNVHPKVPPSDRRILLIYRSIPGDRSILSTEWSKDWMAYLKSHGKEDEQSNLINISATDLDHVVVSNAATIFMYADDLSKEQVFSYLISKTPYIPTIISRGQNNALTIMKEVLRGKAQDYITMVDFHTDFIMDYNREQDIGNAGIQQFNRFLLAYEVSDKKMSIHDQLILYIIANRKGLQLVA